MDGLRTYFKIIDGQNHSPTPNIFHKMQKSLDFVKKKRWINLKARTKRELKYPTIYLANLPSQPKHLGYFGKKTLTWRLLSVHYASQILASPNTCYAYKRKTKQTNLLRR